MIAEETPLSAPLDIGFDYTRSLGGVFSHFMTELANRRITGVRGSDGTVHVPPVEYDPNTAEALSEFVEVADVGTVRAWSWCAQPVERQPIQRPFAWALITLDGADTAMLHAVNVTSPEAMRTGMRVRARWADEPIGHITDIAYFDPVDDAERVGDAPTPARPPAAREDAGGAVDTVITPIHLSYTHSVSPEESRYLRALAEGRMLAQRCPACEKVYIPPRGACPTCGVPTTTEVELPDTGIVTTFCIVNVPFLGQRITPPYVAAYILLDGADIPFLHLVLGCEADEVRMGMRVRAVWKPREEWETSLQNVDHFEPTGEPDAPYDSYAHHL
ncbi:OB-fold domain-containing protein [Haloechinothrix sp. LS1_15]|uniref:Zn-ribbon domain-containing OB-fold protein n=1 Tax=Haloechinothrix sp. LS1_15 TaxID=2652248 RepID=UPI00294670C5|nr:OB-fold domain-containing protein [Haloechinothrix sp. LS1_15]MDV6014152.1 DNA-binding protein [Haloechinothrix sp. LS1_15]